MTTKNDTSNDHGSRFKVDELLSDSAQNLFASTCSFDVVQAAEADGWASSVWDAVAEAGFAWIGLPESAGGSGGSLTDGAEVLRIAGAHAAPIPLAETAMLGGWLLTEAGLELPDGPVSVIPGFKTDSLAVTSSGGAPTLNGSVHRVPWASRSAIVAAIVEVDGQSMVAAIDPSSARIEPATNVAGEPRETIHFDNVTLNADQFAAIDGPDLSDELRLRGALSRTMLMAGALEAMSALTISYAEERQQFGRPIGRFQAVQQHLVWGAQDASIAKMTAQLAAGEAANGVSTARFQITAARTLADEAATSATRWAHQAHGAMGMTQEYALHHLSRRLWAWRHEYATPGEWPQEVGRLAEAAGADGLYPLIAS